MSFRHLDRFAQIDSPLTRRSPTARLLGTVLIALGAAILPMGAWPQMAALAFLVVGLAAAARIPPRAFLARLAPPLAFVFLISAAILFLAPGRAVASVGPLTVTDAGLLRVGSVLGRSTAALGAAVILVSTTPFSQVLAALRTLRLPEAVTTSLGLAYRFLYMLNDEVERLRRAARSRNVAAGAAPRRRLLMGITAAVLQRSFARSEQVHRAMLARGYSGRIVPLQPPEERRHSALELAAFALVVAAVSGSAFL